MPEEQDKRKTLKLIYRGPRLERIELDGKIVTLEGLVPSMDDQVVPSLEELRNVYKIECE